jgi:hypothetical protein
MCDPTHRKVRDEWGTPKIGDWLKENRQRDWWLVEREQTKTNAERRQERFGW